MSTSRVFGLFNFEVVTYESSFVTLLSIFGFSGSKTRKHVFRKDLRKVHFISVLSESIIIGSSF